MIDREKVIKGLEICYWPPSKCEDCPYHDLPDEQSCNDVLCLDALTLLKEQIVRCKDCRHWDAKKHECHNIHSYMQYRPCFQDWFCADGERR